MSYPGLTEGLMIHRHHAPKDWQVQVDALPEELREGARQYLAGPVACYRERIRMAKECGCKSLEEFDQVRKEARKCGAPGAVPWVRAGRPLIWRNGVDAPGKKRYGHN